MNDTVQTLQQRYDFLCDAWLRGMCDGSDVDRAHLQLQAALAATIGIQADKSNSEY